MKDMALRIVHADRWLVEVLENLGGIDRKSAERVARYYVKRKLVKLDAVNGVYRVKHGAFFDRDFIRDAAKVAK